MLSSACLHRYYPACWGVFRKRVDWQIESLAREPGLYSRGFIVLPQTSLNLLGRETEQDGREGNRTDTARRTHRKLAWVKTGRMPTSSGSCKGSMPATGIACKAEQQREVGCCARCRVQPTLQSTNHMNLRKLPAEPAKSLDSMPIVSNVLVAHIQRHSGKLLNPHRRYWETQTRESILLALFLQWHKIEWLHNCLKMAVWGLISKLSKEEQQGFFFF